MSSDVLELRVWRGDITTLKVESIVNASNVTGLGCFTPGHPCIDNAIHRAAGPDLLKECQTLGGIPTGVAKLTHAYRLPCKWIVHVTGPEVIRNSPQEDHTMLAQCYTAVLDLAVRYRIREIAFCCLSTGVFGFDRQRAAHTALQTVRMWLTKNRHAIDRLLFAVFTDEDEKLYRQELPRIFCCAGNSMTDPVMHLQPGNPPFDSSCSASASA